MDISLSWPYINRSERKENTHKTKENVTEELFFLDMPNIMERYITLVKLLDGQPFILFPFRNCLLFYMAKSIITTTWNTYSKLISINIYRYEFYTVKYIGI